MPQRARKSSIGSLARSTNGARTSGISNGEIRRSFIRPRQLPYKSPFGMVVDSGHLRELLA